MAGDEVVRISTRRGIRSDDAGRPPAQTSLTRAGQDRRARRRRTSSLGGHAPQPTDFSMSTTGRPVTGGRHDHQSALQPARRRGARRRRCWRTCHRAHAWRDRPYTHSSSLPTLAARAGLDRPRALGGLPVPETNNKWAQLAPTLEQYLRELDTPRAQTQQIVPAQHKFVADASHELPAPLTNITRQPRASSRPSLTVTAQDAEEAEVRRRRRSGNLGGYAGLGLGPAAACPRGHRSHQSPARVPT